jgi:acrylyl-CoA reductase (NADPH)
VAHHGGFSTFAQVPADWIVPLPGGLDTRTAMCFRTAGFTAALSVPRLEGHGLRPGQGPVLVTGATGGVGSTAVGMLAARGYEVIASSGKDDAREWLISLRGS